MRNLTFGIMGATGRIGHVIVEELLKKGHKVRALGRDADKLNQLKAKGAEIHAGDFTDTFHLTQAFKGCNGVFTFLSPAGKEEDFEVYQEKTSKAIAEAIKKAKITHVVNLSSTGANHTSGTGPVKELHRQEHRLNAIPNLNVLHLRPDYFMENLLWCIPSIKSSGVIATSLREDLLIPMVATHDIGMKAAELLAALNFSGSSFFDFVGPRGITMLEITRLIGKAIGMPDLKYQHLSDKDAEKALLGLGVKPKLSKLFVEMNRAFNDEKMRPTQQITAEHVGKITIEEFVKMFAQMYRSARNAA